MRFACWITKATNTHTHTHTQYITLTAFPLQQWLQERASLLRYTPIACHFFLGMWIDMARQHCHVVSCAKTETDVHFPH
jgi:hypothetical protein